MKYEEDRLPTDSLPKRERAPAAIILAAGASARMGFPKPLLRLGGETFLDRLILLCRSHCSPVIAVLGHHAEQVRAGVRLSSEVRFVVNPEPDRGMLSSLQCGLHEVPADCPAALFTPVDYPRVRETTVAALVEAYRGNAAAVIGPVCEGRHGHPVLVDRPLFAEFLALPPSGRASDVIRRHRKLTIWVPVDDRGVLRDIDTPADLAAEISSPEQE